MAQTWFEGLKSTPININTAGDNILIAAPASPAYLAIDFVQVIPSSAVTLQFFSGPLTPTPNPITGPYPLTGQQVITDENVFQNTDGVFTCAPGTSFNLNLSAGIQCGGIVRYRIVGN